VLGNAVGKVGKVLGNGGKVLGNGGKVLGNGNGNGNVLRPASVTTGAPASVGRTTVGPVVGVPMGTPGRFGVTAVTAGFVPVWLPEPASINGLTVVSGAWGSSTSGGTLESRWCCS
jgi:hypothetical protein